VWAFRDNEYENSIKVPFIVSHPSHVPEDRVETAMVSAYDVMPTLLETLGLPIPSTERNLPGRSFAPLLADRSRSDDRPRSAGEPSQGHECVVIYDKYGPVRMVRTQEWKYVYRHAHGPHELYDLVNDPDERQNLVDEPEQQARIAELKAMMDKWFSRYVDPVRDGLRQDGMLHGQTELAK
jgi:choline-sulfatase